MPKVSNYQKEYRDLEMRIMASLRDAIKNSTYISEHINDKAIRVDVFGYTELAVINDTLTFMDKDGYHYYLYSDAALEDLIDILNSNDNG